MNNTRRTDIPVRPAKLSEAEIEEAARRIALCVKKLRQAGANPEA
jgi:hypothetical protein